MQHRVQLDKELAPPSIYSEDVKFAERRDLRLFAL